MKGIPDWFFHRWFSFFAILAAGYCGDEGWAFCAIAWFAVSAALLLWSVHDQDQGQ